jgi:signal transduction histidine kinase/CheY-like chemotaxis protein
VKVGTLIWPSGLTQLLGYEPSPQTCEINFWLDHIHPDDLAAIKDSLHQSLAGSAESWIGEYRFQHANGEYLHILERAAIVRAPDPRVVSAMHDVTARKQLQSEVTRSQRMEAFGQLAGGVAHDFNNFLTTILGYSDLVLSEQSLPRQLANQVTEIHDAANRAALLTNQLLAFSRRQALEPTVLEINTLVSNLERSLLRLLGENISIVLHLHHRKEGAHVKADAGQLNQILLNLAVNARDAMRQGGRLTIETAVEEVRAGTPPPNLATEFNPGEYVAINVSDNGSGMTEEVKARLFEPFFTTKPGRDRSGLGLATSYGIVRQSGGYITVESELGKGTTFRIFLPRVSAPPPPAYKRRDSQAFLTGTETVLVLEDDVSVRHLTVRLLRKLGYDVIEAAHGDDAKRLIAARGERPIHLLLTDMVMPEISGRTFADWLRRASPQTKVIFVSGYLEESMAPGDRLAPDMLFLPKPFTAEQLATKVREALDGEN